MNNNIRKLPVVKPIFSSPNTYVTMDAKLLGTLISNIINEGIFDDTGRAEKSADEVIIDILSLLKEHNLYIKPK